MTNTAARTRDDALDALRGLAIFGMVLVNLQGSDAHVFPILAHAPWNGLTIADLVFPLFLLCVGLSLPLAMDGREPPVEIGRIVRRSVLLYLIGFSIGWIVHASTHLIDIRFTGVLARIAIVYLVCALTVRSTSGWRVPALAAVALMAVHGALLYAAPPGGVASMAPGEGFSGWLDRAVLGGTRIVRQDVRPRRPALDAVGDRHRDDRRRGAAAGDPAVNVLFRAAVLCFVAAVGAWFLWPINKALWTPTFVLINAAIGLGALCLLKSFWPSIGTFAPVAAGGKARPGRADALRRPRAADRDAGDPHWRRAALGVVVRRARAARPAARLDVVALRGDRGDAVGPRSRWRWRSAAGCYASSRFTVTCLLDQIGAAEDRQEADIGGVAPDPDPRDPFLGREPGRVDQPPAAVEPHLDHRVEILGLERPGVGADHPRRNVGGARQRDQQMRVIAAHAAPSDQRVDRGRADHAGLVGQMAADPVDHRRNPITARRITELAPHHRVEPVGLAIPAREQIRHDVGGQRLHIVRGQARATRVAGRSISTVAV